MKKTLLLLALFIATLTQAQTVLIPNGGFNDALDIGFWSVASTPATKSWFDGGCQAMFVNNLGNPATTVTSSVFSVGLSGDYELELEYAVIYSGTAAIFELVDANSAVISATSINTVTGTCTDWPSPKHSSLVFANLPAGNYQLRITIPSSQFFLDGVALGAYNPITVSGNVNTTGCTNNNMLNNFPIKITDLSDNSSAYTATINGVYNFILPNTSGNFLIEPVNNGNIVATPNGINLTISSSSASYINNDFCLTSNINGVEVQAQLVSQNLARPGFVASYDLIYGNNGNITTGSESLVLNFDSSKLAYVTNSASVVPASVTGNSITWNYTNLTSLEFRNITFSFNVLAPPTVSGGDVLSFTGNITPIADVDPSNNTINLNQVVVNAYDPNDVLCMEGDEISPTQIGDDLTYRIRFQNTGTASAVNISVKTDLDADLDWATFQPISASHAYTTSLVNGNELTYTFNNINLDDATTNEPGSHGWIFYKIKPKSTAAVGDTFDATASIYFDFNTAVVTNTYTTTIVMPAVPETYVPDDNFENYLETHDAFGNVVAIGATNSMGNGTANDDYVTSANINAVTVLSVNSLFIEDLTGIEDFTSLKVLNCIGNQISVLNFSSNIALEKLNCRNNQLTSLNVVSNTALVEINCRFNLLTSLAIAPNNTLEELYCSYNQLSSLNMSSNTALEYLWCTNNQLTSLNLDNCSSMSQLRSENNQLTSLDLSSCIVLNEGHLQNNQLTSLNIKTGTNANNAPNYLVITNNPNLFCVEIDSDSYVGSGWSTGFNYSENCHYTETYVPDDNFEARLIALGHDSGPLDDYVPTANIDALTTLDLEDQGIVDMTGIEDFVALEFLYCHTNSIATLDVSSNINLTTLNCSGNALTTLDVTLNPNLTYLSCGQNQISSLTINNSSLLTDLLITNNQLTSFDASGFSNLIDFRSGDNLLTSLNIKNGNNTNFVLFQAGNNPNLTCIQVDDAAWSTTNWTNVDAQTGFNEDCATTAYDGYEPNDSFAEAVNMPLCNIYNPTIGEPGDLDFFTFPLEAGIGTEVIINNIPVGLTYKVTFFDSYQQTTPPFYVTSSDPLTRYVYSPLSSFYYVKIESNNANYSVLPYQIEVSNANCSLSVSEVFKSSFNAFPNPVNNSLTVSIQEDANYSLITVNGQVVKQGQLQKGENTLNTSNLSNGLYFLQVRTKEGVSTKKIVKQ